MARAEIVEVIKTASKMGEGTINDPCRIIVEYWTKDGELIVAIDQCAGLRSDFYMEEKHDV